MALFAVITTTTMTHCYSVYLCCVLLILLLCFVCLRDGFWSPKTRLDADASDSAVIARGATILRRNVELQQMESGLLERSHDIIITSNEDTRSESLRGYNIRRARSQPDREKPFPLNSDASADSRRDSITDSDNNIKPVKVFILLGQSNMLGLGKVSGGDGSLEYAVKEKGLYQYLLEDDGDEWKVRRDVRNVRVMGSGNSSMSVMKNEWMTISERTTIGPEIGIGHSLGNATDAPVLILKSCIGNRALGWDLLPPGSERYEYTESNGVTQEYAGYRDESPIVNTEPPQSGGGWFAGIQYEGDVDRAKQVLADLQTFFPGASTYDVAGFFWWQGDKDSRIPAYASRYEVNLVQLIKQLRIDFAAPEAKFVCASLGQSMKGYTDGGGQILDAMLAVDGRSGKYPEFQNNVAAVYAHLLSKGGSSGSHYGFNAETYMNVGEAMGNAMVDLLKGIE